MALIVLGDTLEPDSEKILGNVELLPSISNPAALPHCDINGDESSIRKNIPGCLLPQKEHNAKDILPSPTNNLEIQCSFSPKNK
jgi:hypothetical protein